MEPLVTVLLPVYNASSFLKTTIDSILSQTYRNIEVLIIDDGSTDHSSEIVSSYNDTRIKHVINEKNIGIVKTLNRGIDLANGKYVARMDADDICFVNRIEKQVGYLENHPNVAVVATMAELINEKGLSLNKYDSPDIGAKKLVNSLAFDNYICHPSVMIRKDILARYKYRNTYYEDYDLWLRLANNNHGIEKIKEPLLFYRMHNKSIMGSDKMMGNNFIKQAKTKKFYLKNLPFKDKMKKFNIKVYFFMIYSFLLGYYKLIKAN